MKSIKDNSSSQHILNGDFGLNIINKVLWLLANFRENYFNFSKLDRSINRKKFIVDDTLLNNYQRIGSGDYMPSPARLLADLFWNSLDPTKIKNFLQDEIRSIEIGAGHGIYGEFIMKNFGKNTSYVGIDPQKSENWITLPTNQNFQFHQASSSEVNNFLDNKNFIFTQSAIEHFVEDLKFFKLLARYVNDQNFPIYQIHIMPSEACLFTYPWHGVRQYNKKNISLINRLFPNSDVTLFSLGGSQALKLHLRHITLPNLLRKKDLRKTNSDLYNSYLNSAVKKDFNSNNLDPCSFYALVIQSNYKNRN